jgi:hypothetical protein
LPESVERPLPTARKKWEKRFAFSRERVGENVSVPLKIESRGSRNRDPQPIKINEQQRADGAKV